MRELSKNMFGFKYGFTVEACSASIAFLWNNWEVLYAINPGKIDAERLPDETWHGSWGAKGFLGRGQYHLLKKSVGVNEGRFDFITHARFLGSAHLKANTIMEYKRIDKKTISYTGRSSMMVPGALRPVGWLLETMAKMAGTYINRIGGDTAELITENPKVVKEKAGEDMYRLYQEYVREERAIRRGGQGPFNHFIVKDVSPDKTTDVDEVSALRQKLEELERGIKRLKGEVKDLMKQHHTSLSVYQATPSLALVQNRTIIEHIAKIMYFKEFGQPNRSRNLDRIIDKIAEKSEKVPTIIIALMRNVALLGDVGGHPDGMGTARTVIDAGVFNMSFSATLKVTEWFFVEYLETEAANSVLK